MVLLDISPDEVEENIKDNQRRLELQGVQDDNKHLCTKETGFEDRVETAKANLEKYNSQLELVKQHLEMAKHSVATVKKEKQAFTQAVAEHKRALTTFCQTMESSTVAMAAILAQTIMITECKDLLKKQLGQTVSRLYDAISDSKTIGSVPDNGWVH